MIKVLALACVFMLTACSEAKPGPLPPEPSYSFTSVELVAVSDDTDTVTSLENPIELTSKGAAKLFFSTLPSEKKLMKAYEAVAAQNPRQVWIGFVYQTCLPPLMVRPYISAEALRFNVIIDPENQYVDCAREPRPVLGIVGVTESALDKP